MGVFKTVESVGCRVYDYTLVHMSQYQISEPTLDLASTMILPGYQTRDSASSLKNTCGASVT